MTSGSTELPGGPTLAAGTLSLVVLVSSVLTGLLTVAIVSVGAFPFVVGSVAATVALGAAWLMRFRGDLLQPGTYFAVWSTFPIVAFWLRIGAAQDVEILRYPVVGSPSGALVNAGIAIALTGLGVAIYAVGVRIAFARARDRLRVPRLRHSPDWHRRACDRTSVVLTLTSVVFFALYVGAAGGLDDVLVLSQRRSTAAGLHYLRAVALWSQFVSPLIIVATPRLSHVRVIAAGLALVGGTLIALSLGGRAQVITGVLLVVVAVHYQHRRIRLQEGVIGALAVLLFLGWFLDVRTATRDEPLVPALQSADVDFETLRSGLEGSYTIDAFASVIGVFGRERQFLYGEPYLRLTFAPIPRSLWPEKPVVEDAGIIGRAILGREDAFGVTPGPAGLMYANFHLPGVVFGLLVLGALHGRMYAWAMAHRADIPAAVVAYGFTVVALRSPAASIVVDIGMVLPVVVLFAVLSRRARRAQTQREKAAWHGPVSVPGGT